MQVNIELCEYRWFQAADIGLWIGVQSICGMYESQSQYARLDRSVKLKNVAS